MFTSGWGEFFKTKDNKGTMGLEYAKKFPWQVRTEDLERLGEYMGRPKGISNKKKPSDPFLEALEFIGFAANKDEQPYMQHCFIKRGFITMFNGQVSAGFPIEMEDLYAAPNYKLILKALKNTGKELSITVQENGSMSIKGEKLRTVIPCLPISDMPDIGPDNPIVTISDTLKKAFEICGAFTSEDGTRLLETSLLLRANDCTGSDGHSVIQFWHGHNLPPDLIIPITFAKAVSKTAKTITAFGWTEGHSITFYFDGGMWMKTLLYADKWPPIDQIFETPFNYIPMITGLCEAASIVDDFTDNNALYFRDNSIGSHPSDLVGATYDVPGLQGGKIVEPKYLTKVLPLAINIDYTSHPDRIGFSGEDMRGIIMTRRS